MTQERNYDYALVNYTCKVVTAKNRQLGKIQDSFGKYKTALNQQLGKIQDSLRKYRTAWENTRHL